MKMIKYIKEHLSHISKSEKVSLMGNVGLFDVGVWSSSGKGQLWTGLYLPWSPGLSGTERRRMSED